MSTPVYPPSDDFVRQAHVQGMEGYLDLYRRAEARSRRILGRLRHREYPLVRELVTQVLDWQPPFAKWFVGAKTNVSYNCLDRHLTTHRKNKVAILWEGEPRDKAISA